MLPELVTRNNLAASVWADARSASARRPAARRGLLRSGLAAPARVPPDERLVGRLLHVRGGGDEAPVLVWRQVLPAVLVDELQRRVHVIRRCRRPPGGSPAVVAISRQMRGTSRALRARPARRLRSARQTGPPRPGDLGRGGNRDAGTKTESIFCLVPCRPIARSDCRHWRFGACIATESRVVSRYC